MRRPPAATPAFLIGGVVLIGLALFVVLGLGRGGFGMAHMLAGLLIAVVGGAFAMMRGRR